MNHSESCLFAFNSGSCGNFLQFLYSITVNGGGARKLPALTCVSVSYLCHFSKAIGVHRELASVAARTYPVQCLFYWCKVFLHGHL